MAAFMADLRARNAIAARALEFLILTNVRTDAVLKAAWEEFDLDQALWTRAAGEPQGPEASERGLSRPSSCSGCRDRGANASGARRTLRLPGAGSRQALIEHGAAYAPKANELEGAEKNWIDRASGPADHGMHQDFGSAPSGPGQRRSRPSPMQYAFEQAMGHQVGTQVERAYRRTDVLDKRRQLMDTWAQWCEPESSSNVVQLAREQIPDLEVPLVI